MRQRGRQERDATVRQMALDDDRAQGAFGSRRASSSFTTPARPPAVTSSDPETMFLARAEAYQREQRVALAVAYAAVAKDDPTLAQQAGYLRQRPADHDAVAPVSAELDAAIEREIDAICARPGAHRLRTDATVRREAREHVEATRPDLWRRYREEYRAVEKYQVIDGPRDLNVG
jgi:hypothetical protein